MIPNINKINQKKIIKILIGDTSIQDVSHHTIKMPHLSGNDIFSLFEEMNLKSNVENGVSRWMVMEDFIKTSIKADCLNRSLTCIFTKIDPSEVDFSLNTPKETLSYIPSLTVRT